MADGGGKLFTSATITEATGEEAHEQVEELEAIFGGFEQLDPNALRQCRALRRFTLLNSRLQRIAHFEPVAATLVHLCLSNQCISKMQGLTTLTQLRVLYLHNNRIERIEGLENCRKLQTLWLYGNQITHVENLDCCLDLRDLWLQSNRIKTLAGGGVSSLVNLRSLHLADNDLRHVNEFQYLRKQIVLHDVSFRDEHFGSNPIVDHPDYRSFAMAMLKQLQKLDGVAIKRSERSAVEDQFLTQTLEFNDRIAELTLAYQQELQSLAARRERGVSNAQMLQSELVEALNNVEACVLDGQAQIWEEKQRQLRLQDENAQLLRENVDNIKVAFHAAVDSKYEKAMQALEMEEQQCCAMEMEALAEQEQALAIATIQAMFPSRIAFQQLLQHTPDYRFIATAFGHASPPSSDEDERVAGLTILQIYRYFHRDLIEDFNSACDENNPMGSCTTGTELYLYLVLNADEVGPTLQNGIASHQPNDNNQNPSDGVSNWVFLFSRPEVATQFYRGMILDLDDLENEDAFAQDNNRLDNYTVGGLDTSPTAESPLLRTYNLLLCRVRASQIVELFYPQTQSCQRQSLGTLESLLSIAAPREDAILPPPPHAFLQLTLPSQDDAGGESHVYMARRESVHAQILPQFILLCSKRGVPSVDDKAPPKPLGVDSMQLVAECQRQLQGEIDAFHTRLYREVDPATARVRTQLLQHQESACEQLRDATAQVADEKRAQNELLRTLLPKR